MDKTHLLILSLVQEGDRGKLQVQDSRHDLVKNWKLRMSDKASAQASTGSEEAWKAWEWLTWGQVQPHPGYSAFPGAESTRTQCGSYLGSQAWQDMGQEISLAQILLKGMVKTEWWFISSWQWDLLLWETRRVKWGKSRKWIQATHAGPPRGHLSLQQWRSSLKRTQGAEHRKGRQVSTAWKALENS